MRSCWVRLKSSLPISLPPCPTRFQTLLLFFWTISLRRVTKIFDKHWKSQVDAFGNIDREQKAFILLKVSFSLRYTLRLTVLFLNPEKTTWCFLFGSFFDKNGNGYFLSDIIQVFLAWKAIRVSWTSLRASYFLACVRLKRWVVEKIEEREKTISWFQVVQDCNTRLALSTYTLSDLFRLFW